MSGLWRPWTLRGQWVGGLVPHLVLAAHLLALMMAVRVQTVAVWHGPDGKCCSERPGEPPLCAHTLHPYVLLGLGQMRASESL